MPRPADLPEFTLPPLVEVAVSVQFETLKGYQQIWARPIWELFKGRFGAVQEQLPLQPTFETFGAPVPPIMNFDFVQTPIQTRLWFINSRRFNSEVQQRCIDDMAEHRGWGKGRGQGRKSPAAMRT